MKLALGQIGEYLNAGGDFEREALALGYSIDSRKIQPGELFFAVKGERLDGHDYVEAALEAGAVAAVVAGGQLPRFKNERNLIVVEDTLEALQRLAHSVRLAWGKPLIAVTGSAGKTTTKELIARLLSTRYRVHKTEGNLNNHFGLPLQLLKLGPEHDIAVIELGMSHPGEIESLARIAEPETGVVTCVAPVHLGYFRSIAGIAKAKQELIDALPARGIAILNADDEYVVQFGMNFAGKVVMYGINRPADVRAENIEGLGPAGSAFELSALGQRCRVELPLLGRHNVYNALGAVAVALEFGITLENAGAALASVSAVDKRGQVIEVAGATVINDCYNSNPKALDSMVDALAAMNPGPGGRRIVVAGEMLELGPAGDDLHRRCGAHMAEKGIDAVLGVRGLARHIVQGARHVSRRIQVEFVESPEQAGEWLSGQVRPGDVVLMKASRGVKLEMALEAWQAKSLAVSK